MQLAMHKNQINIKKNIQITNFSQEIQIKSYLVARVILLPKTAMSSNEHLEICY